MKPALSSSSERTDNLRKGIAFMLLATALFAVADALGKLLTQQYPFMQIVWLRSAFGLTLIGLAIIATGNMRHFKSSRPAWHVSRSLAGIILTIGIFAGLKHIPLAEVTALVFANPLFVAVYTSLFLKERVSASSYAAIGVGFIGVLLVTRPTPQHFHVAHLYMLGFAAATAFLIITARKLNRTESVLTLNFYIYPATLLLSSFWAFSDWVMPDLLDWLLFFAVALFATLALYCVTQAMQSAKPAQVAPLDYSRMLWTLAIGYLFWGELPDPLTWVGIVIIMVCGIYIVSQGRAVPQSGVKQPSEAAARVPD